MGDDDLDDDLWDKLGGAPDADATDAAAGDDEVVVDIGPPIRVTFVLRAERIPVAPWAQGWRVGAAGPHDGHVTLVCEHDMDHSPVAQLSAITGLLGTIKQAQLDVAWWAMQTRGPIDEPDAADDFDRELSQLLDDAASGEEPSV